MSAWCWSGRRRRGSSPTIEFGSFVNTHLTEREREPRDRGPPPSHQELSPSESRSMPETAAASSVESYAEHVNPQWVRLLTLLDMNGQYERCQGTELISTDGRRILDFLSGYCVHNTGHNHPYIVAGLK